MYVFTAAVYSIYLIHSAECSYTSYVCFFSVDYYSWKLVSSEDHRLWFGEGAWAQPGPDLWQWRQGMLYSILAQLLLSYSVIAKHLSVINDQRSCC